MHESQILYVSKLNVYSPFYSLLHRFPSRRLGVYIQNMRLLRRANFEFSIQFLGMRIEFFLLLPFVVLVCVSFVFETLSLTFAFAYRHGMYNLHVIFRFFWKTKRELRVSQANYCTFFFPFSQTMTTNFLSTSAHLKRLCGVRLASSWVAQKKDASLKMC